MSGEGKFPKDYENMLALEIFEDGGVFRHGDGYDAIVDELDEALSQRDAGAITPGRYLRTLTTIVERHPHFIDGHAHLGNALMEKGKPKLALRACLRGFEAGLKAMPADYAGRIEWISLDNRPFLRAAHGTALSYLRLGQRKEALAIMEKILAWNPNDNQGIRFLIGSEYLRTGESDKADRLFAEEADSYPPYHYERALLRFRADNFEDAATSLRQGFVANLYLAEILSGNPEPASLAIWHGSNLAEPETARDYLEHCGDLWRRTPGAIDFVRWLFTHPKVMRERADVLECQHALFWKMDPARRRTIIEEEDGARQRIDSLLSGEVVQKRVDNRGRTVWPWLHSR